MAQRLEKFPASKAQRYPWDQWLNGEVWQLFLGEDFSAKPATLITNARNQAKRRGGQVRTRIISSGDRTSVVLQFA
jgi:hypothetical protein